MNKDTTDLELLIRKISKQHEQIKEILTDEIKLGMLSEDDKKLFKLMDFQLKACKSSDTLGYGWGEKYDNKPISQKYRATVEDCVNEAKASGFISSGNISIFRFYKYRANVDTDGILEAVNDEIYELYEKDDSIDWNAKEDIAELDKELNECLNNWLVKTNQISDEWYRWEKIACIKVN